ncbi:hypothetical protein D3C77_145340 [compost metagenome]
MLGIKTLSSADFRIIPIPRKGYARTGLGEKAEYRNHAVFQFPSLFTERKITEEILHNHTLYPLTAALGRSTTDTIVTPTIWKKICPDCAYEDYENHGTAYVHRSHAQASVQVCSIHGSNLIATCPTCSTPIKNHDITGLGICSQKYKNSTRQLNSSNHSYSIFIAELLNYKGAPAKANDAQWIVGNSLYIKYFNEMYSDDNYLSKLITSEFGVKSINSNYRAVSDQRFTIQAFLGCRTAERYLDLLKNKASTAQLQKEVNALNHARRRRKSLTA